MGYHKIVVIKLVDNIFPQDFERKLLGQFLVLWSNTPYRLIFFLSFIVLIVVIGVLCSVLCWQFWGSSSFSTHKTYKLRFLFLFKRGIRSLFRPDLFWIIVSCFWSVRASDVWINFALDMVLILLQEILESFVFSNIYFSFLPAFFLHSNFFVLDVEDPMVVNWHLLLLLVFGHDRLITQNVGLPDMEWNA